MRARPDPIVVILAAVVAMSWAAPLIRLTRAPPLAVAAWRVTLATIFLLPFFLARSRRTEWARVPPRDRGVAVLAGGVLALHFAAWITSLRLTSVAASSVLVSLSPAFAWVFSRRILGEQPQRREAVGILLAALGAGIIALADTRGGGRGAIVGDALALAAGACGGLYLVLGRRLRPTLSLAAYVTPVYGVAAAVLLASAALRGEAFAAYAPADWAIFVALAAGPMLVGHTGLNYALRYLPAYTVNVAALGEPVGATLLAWILPAIAEPPGLAAVVGGAVALVGIAVTLAGPATR
ncbi:MAG: DMT family transporter [Gemmatimonadetes bacterium]|nr:DMT family transporter [Gemmatimonadota bacterium]